MEWPFGIGTYSSGWRFLCSIRGGTKLDVVLVEGGTKLY